MSYPSVRWYVYIGKYLQLKCAVSIPEKIAICLYRVREESLGNRSQMSSKCGKTKKWHTSRRRVCSGIVQNRPV